MLFVCILGWEQQKLFRTLIWEPFPWIIFQEMLTIPLVFRELQSQHHKWHLYLYLCLQRFLVLHVCLSWCALGGKDIPNIVNQMATKKCLFTKCMEELDKVRSQRCSYAVSRRRCFLLLLFFFNKKKKQTSNQPNLSIASKASFESQLVGKFDTSLLSQKPHLKSVL